MSVELCPLYLNAGMLTMMIDLGFERLGFKTTRRELTKTAPRSLFWSLCLVSTSGVVALVIRTRLSGLSFISSLDPVFNMQDVDAG